MEFEQININRAVEDNEQNKNIRRKVSNISANNEKNQ